MICGTMTRAQADKKGMRPGRYEFAVFRARDYRDSVPGDWTFPCGWIGYGDSEEEAIQDARRWCAEHGVDFTLQWARVWQIVDEEPKVAVQIPSSEEQKGQLAAALLAAGEKLFGAIEEIDHVRRAIIAGAEKGNSSDRVRYAAANLARGLAGGLGEGAARIRQATYSLTDLGRILLALEKTQSEALLGRMLAEPEADAP